MRNLKKEDGVTLIILVITIIIMILLAGVSISNIKTDGLIDRGKETSNQIDEFGKYTQNDINDITEGLTGSEPD